MGEETPNPSKDKQAGLASVAPSMKPLEMKVADSIFLTMRKNMVLFKVLTAPSIHYSLFTYGSTFDLHSTYENKSGKNQHRQIVKMEIDWEFLNKRMFYDLSANWSTILRRAKISDPEVNDLDVEFITPQMLQELLTNALNKNRWNVNVDFLNKLEDSLQHARLGEITSQGVNFGWSSEGHFVISNGDEFWILDSEKLIKILFRNFELSIRNLHVSHFTIGLLTWVAKIRLLRFNQMVINRLTGRQ